MRFDDFTISRIEFRLTAEAIGSDEEEEEESVDCHDLFCQKHISITLGFFIWQILKKRSLFPVFNLTGQDLKFYFVALPKIFCFVWRKKGQDSKMFQNTYCKFTVHVWFQLLPKTSQV